MVLSPFDGRYFCDEISSPIFALELAVKSQVITNGLFDLVDVNCPPLN